MEISDSAPFRWRGLCSSVPVGWTHCGVEVLGTEQCDDGRAVVIG